VVLSTLSLCEGDNDMVEKPVDPVRVYSERELTKEFEKVAGMLTAEQDWSIRMAAMQRVEGLIFGGLSFSHFMTCHFATPEHVFVMSVDCSW
jgi:hypothetical protein